jgi:broad specificity phosphatase PhoE
MGVEGGAPHHVLALYASTALLSLAVAWLAVRLHSLDRSRLATYPPVIVLIRHAESEGNVDEDAYRTIGDPMIALTPRGRSQAVAMSMRLHALVGELGVWAFTSPYTRSRETADLALAHFPPARCRLAEDPRLREQEFAGSFQHSVPDRSEQRQYGKFFFRYPGGESAADVYDRMSMFMDTLWRDMHRVDLSQTAVVVFGHGLTNRLFCMRWLHWSPRVFERTRNPPNCSFIVLRLQPADATGQPYYKLTAESLSMLGLAEADGLSDLAESAPSSWARSRLYAPQLQLDYASATLHAASVHGLRAPTIAGGSCWRSGGRDWKSSRRASASSQSQAEPG